jgi:hypothetical protein
MSFPQQVAVTIPLQPSAIRHPKLGEIRSHPRPRFKGHWALVTTDLPKTDGFYRALTRAALICVPIPGTVAISWDIEHHRFFVASIATLRRSQDSSNALSPVGTRIGDAGGCIRFSGPRALVEAYRRLHERGDDPHRILERERSLSLFYTDPEGALVEAAAPKTPRGTKTTELSVADFLQRYSNS